MRKIHVLLADDREAERADMVECLNSDGRFDAKECELAKDSVLRAVAAGEWDILVLDVELRSVENRTADAVDQTFGLRLLEDIDPVLSKAGIKVALLTIHDVRVSGSEVAAKIRDLVDRGAAHVYLRKPFMPARHIPVLERLAGRSDSDPEAL